MANATAQHVLASLDCPGSGVGDPNTCLGREGEQCPSCHPAPVQDPSPGWAAGAGALEDVTVAGVWPGSRPSAGFSNKGSLLVSMHCTVHYRIFSSAIGNASKYFRVFLITNVFV